MGNTLTRARYNRLTEKQMQSMRWRTVKAIGSASHQIPAGALVVVTEKHGGLGIEALACQSCGVRARIRKCDPWDIEELSEEEYAEALKQFDTVAYLRRVLREAYEELQAPTACNNSHICGGCGHCDGWEREREATLARVAEALALTA